MVKAQHYCVRCERAAEAERGGDYLCRYCHTVMAVDYRKYAWLLSVLVVFVLEYFLIIALSFPDPFVHWWGGAYLILWMAVMCIMFWRVFEVKLVEVATLMLFYALVVVIPIGIMWALIQGYGWHQLLGYCWMTTSDFGYVFTTSLFTGVGIILWGGCRVRWRKKA